MPPPPSSRPQRLRIINELGLPQTLAAGASQFVELTRRGDSPVLLLGLGPDPDSAAASAGQARDVLYMEAPRFESQAGEGWHQALPDHWRRIRPETLSRQELLQILRPFLQQGRVLHYRQGPRLFPSFWAPVLAALRWLAAGGPPAPTSNAPSVLLPARADALLSRELRDGFTACGMAVRLLELPDRHRQQRAPGDHLLQALAEEVPALYCSVNFQGLDAHGEDYHLLRTAGVQVAVWCVDNPWHLLSGLKAPFWQELQLFVSDASFIPGLRNAGARHVEHLPLAAWPEGLAGTTPPPLPPELAGLASRLLFVGRSSFPQKQSFFAGLQPPAPLWEEALAMLERGRRPDFHWWRKRLDIGALWPGREARRAGCGAEEAGMQLRLRCLQAAAALGALDVVGDAAWQALLGEQQGRDTRYHPPVDYYGLLPHLYREARYTCNATSLLLPAGLTQRHFDVWTAGGFLLSDATPGLELFPAELTQPMTVDGGWSRRSLESRLDELERQPGLREELAAAWREHLLAQHTYRHRAARIMACCGF